MQLGWRELEGRRQTLFLRTVFVRTGRLQFLTAVFVVGNVVNKIYVVPITRPTKVANHRLTFQSGPLISGRTTNEGALPKQSPRLGNNVIRCYKTRSVFLNISRRFTTISATVFGHGLVGMVESGDTPFTIARHGYKRTITQT